MDVADCKTKHCLFGIVRFTNNCRQSSASMCSCAWVNAVAYKNKITQNSLACAGVSVQWFYVYIFLVSVCCFSACYAIRWTFAVLACCFVSFERKQQKNIYCLNVPCTVHQYSQAVIMNLHNFGFRFLSNSNIFCVTPTFDIYFSGTFCCGVCFSIAQNVKIFNVNATILVYWNVKFLFILYMLIKFRFETKLMEEILNLSYISVSF